MSQHQKRQGYYPSLNSMFVPTDDRTPVQSTLFSVDKSGSGSGKSIYSPNAPPTQTAPPQSRLYYNMPPPPPPPPGSGQYSSYQGPSRPAPPVPPAPPSAPAPPPPTESRPNRPESDPANNLKNVSLPRECLPRFLAIASLNTLANRETCGLLLGKDKGHRYSVTTLLIPKQHATSDTCTMDEEELVMQFTEERSLITLGWVSCFLVFVLLGLLLADGSLGFVDTHAPISILFVLLFFCALCVGS